jgi:hypothetical protein
MLTFISAFNVSRLVLAQVKPSVISIVTAPLPVFTVTSPEPSIVASWIALKDASFAVAVHTPAEQEMFFVGLSEMFNDAEAGDARTAADAAQRSNRGIIMASTFKPGRLYHMAFAQ